MFRILSGDIDVSDPDLADRIYKFRHAYFVEYLRWESCRRRDGRECDQFDGPNSIHILGEEGRDILAYARLLPTTRPHLLSHLYPEILQGGAAPTGRRIYEWTRHAIAVQMRESAMATAFSNVVSGAVAYAAEALDLEGLLVQLHPSLIARLIETGWDAEPLALPTKYQGSYLVPVYARLTEQTLLTAQAAFTNWRGARLHVSREFIRTAAADVPTPVLG
ncbi:acyl-homoserine-lactone synthase [Methylobacterium brachiatum]|uniref:Acyl-homoserine-lactone synthase n=1 Tax=Methylobacterium brachiatum TaxID=269660 RepID=A0AAJ1TQX8_9HYPH|nr:acyl-homoserine-lactone synthase [Methylobacterium brachiatum]AYO81564.1 GNAT family N-acetyltransferase [Methylobacterium brachiatum]MCB4802623.1 GNAT family N-acetyltransferase [Methylobacterium brachiatum]MDQ0543249.1 acyl-homoserine lactone synthase [Methylobacterium brachiatum]